MNTVMSHDGTPIAYDQAGEGRPLILVDGALNARRSGSKAELVALLAPHFTVYSYDRRGRGDSGDTPPYAVEREIDDIEALIVRAGGDAFLYGHSSGGCLALDAAARLGPKVTKVAAYEAPYDDDPAAQASWSAYLDQLDAALASGRRGDAVALFMRYVGIPAEQIDGMRQAPFWAGLEAIAPTLAYDQAGVIGRSRAVPAEMLAIVAAPVLAIYGGASPPQMHAAAESISRLAPNGRLLTLAGQVHNVQPAAIAPALIDFFSA
jgi:pimeloyl-ACP methyl ester carboxylesterase